MSEEFKPPPQIPQEVWESLERLRDAMRQLENETGAKIKMEVEASPGYGGKRTEKAIMQMWLGVDRAPGFMKRQRK